MEKSDIDLVELMFGEDGVAYERGATLGCRVFALAETVRRRFEKAGYFVRGQNPLLPEKAKQIIEERERKERALLGAG